MREGKNSYLLAPALAFSRQLARNF